MDKICWSFIDIDRRPEPEQISTKRIGLMKLLAFELISTIGLSVFDEFVTLAGVALTGTSLTVLDVLEGLGSCQFFLGH